MVKWHLLSSLQRLKLELINLVRSEFLAAYVISFSNMHHGITTDYFCYNAGQASFPRFWLVARAHPVRFLINRIGSGWFLTSKRITVILNSGETILGGVYIGEYCIIGIIAVICCFSWKSEIVFDNSKY